MGKNKGYRVKPQGTVAIRALARYVRNEFKIEQAEFPIVLFIETLAEGEAIGFEVVSKEEMPDKFGLTYPARNLIKIREDTYGDAVKGGGFGRFTLAHEFGHLLLHRDAVNFARSNQQGNHKTYEDSEWQADKFAQELLIDTRKVPINASPEYLRTEFKISNGAARTAHKALIREGIIKPHSMFSP